MTTELQRLWDNAWNAAQERQWLYGRLGFIGDSGGTITLQVPHRKDFVYVRMGFAGDRGVDIARRRPGVQLRPNLPVKMRRENGVLVIYEADYALMENDLNNPIDESGVTLHYHEFVNLSDVPSTYVGQTGKIVAVNATEDALEFVDHVAPDPLLINTIQAKTVSGITFLDSNLNEMLKLTDDNTLEIPGEFATINFTGTPGGDDEGITYLDSFSALRFGLFFPGSDIVALANRASNGVVHIRANDATAGELGETTAAVFEHDQIQLLPSGGNVGIGTNTPSQALDVIGSIYASETIQIQRATGIANVIADAADGNEAAQFIGRAGTSDFRFTTHGDTRTGNRGGIPFAGMGEFTMVTGTSMLFAGIPAIPIHFMTDSVVRATIAADGNVGIGTTTPGSRLVVDQNSTTAAIPVLSLNQDDLSEEFIRFGATIGASNPISTAALGTYYGKIRVSVNGTFKYIGLFNS